METRPIEFERTPVGDSRREKPLTARLSDLSKTLLQSGALLWREVTSPARPHSGVANPAPQNMATTFDAQDSDSDLRGPNLMRVDPKIRAIGKARLDIASRVHSHEDWEALWIAPRYGFPFSWGPSWRHCFEYQVGEFAAEIGFFVDVLGFPIGAIGPEYAMFSSPDQAFYFSVVPAPPGGTATPPEAVRMQFQVADLHAAIRTLKRRGVTFEQEPAPLAGEGGLCRGSFRTPNGIGIDLLGEMIPQSPLQPPFSRGEARLSPNIEPPSPASDENESELEMDDGDQDQEALPLAGIDASGDHEDVLDKESQEDWLDLEYTDEV